MFGKLLFGSFAGKCVVWYLYMVGSMGIGMFISGEVSSSCYVRISFVRPGILFRSASVYCRGYHYLWGMGISYGGGHYALGKLVSKGACIFKRVLSMVRSAIGHCRNMRGLGKSMVVFCLVEKLTYSNERSTIF